MGGHPKPWASRPWVVLALLSLALLLQLIGAQPANAAKPPSGRIYFTALVGVEAPYAPLYQCFEFTKTDVCSLDGGLCGTWQRTSPVGPTGSFSFQLSFLDEAGPVTIDGFARVDSAGPESSIGGAGSQLEAGRRLNFSVAGRETSEAECLDLLREVADDDDGGPVDGSGNPVTESRDVSGFDSVALSGVGTLIIVHGPSESLTVTADDNILPLLTSEVIGGQLRLTSEGSFSTDNPIVYRLTVIELDEILVSGAAGVEATGIDTEVFRLTLAGASVADLDGAVDRQIVSLSGACVYQGEDLDSRVATVDLAGASVAVVRVRELLEGRVAGVSLLEYIGSPTVNLTGGGTWRPRED